MVVEKNLYGLISVFHKYKQQGGAHKLVLLGDGPLREELFSHVSKLGLSLAVDAESAGSDIYWLGQVPSVDPFMANSRALVLCSFAEGMPMVILEALANGLPVLSADGPSGGERFSLSLNSFAANSDSTEVAGFLLPIPESIKSETIDAWVEAMIKIEACEDFYENLKKNTYKQAAFFTQDNAYDLWRKFIN